MFNAWSLSANIGAKKRSKAMAEQLKQIRKLLEQMVELQEETIDWLKKIYTYK